MKPVAFHDPFQGRQRARRQVHGSPALRHVRLHPAIARPTQTIEHHQRPARVGNLARDRPQSPRQQMVRRTRRIRRAGVPQLPLPHALQAVRIAHAHVGVPRVLVGGQDGLPQAGRHGRVRLESRDRQGRRRGEHLGGTGAPHGGPGQGRDARMGRQSILPVGTAIAAHHAGAFAASRVTRLIAPANVETSTLGKACRAFHFPANVAWPGSSATFSTCVPYRRTASDGYPAWS